VFIDMSPEEIQTHALVKVEVCNKVHQLVQKDDLGILLLDRVLVTNEDADLSNEPDGSFISYERVESGAVRLVPRANEADQFLEVQGSPDWVLEIVSDSSVKKDTQDLRERYHAAGIPEYWLIDARGEELEFTLLVAKKGGYAPAPQQKGWQRSKVFGRWFRLTRKRGRLDLWRYNLQVRK
jgi:Uma2 family endonuclease